MTEEIQALLDRYWDWLRDKSTLREMDGWVEITTPYLDRHNDQLQMYAARQGNGYVLTDDGYVLDDLEQSGCKIDGGRRQALFEMTINGFGVQRVDNQLQVIASKNNFALRKHKQSCASHASG